MIFFRPGDIVKFRPVDREEYDDDPRGGGTRRVRAAHRAVEFSLEEFEADIAGYPPRILEALYGN